MMEGGGERPFMEGSGLISSGASINADTHHFPAGYREGQSLAWQIHPHQNTNKFSRSRLVSNVRIHRRLHLVGSL